MTKHAPQAEPAIGPGDAKIKLAAREHDAGKSGIEAASEMRSAQTGSDGPLESPQGQSNRFIAKARELGLDEREETFDAALTRVARRKVAVDRK